jgi:hypothetical protein
MIRPVEGSEVAGRGALMPRLASLLVAVSAFAVYLPLCPPVSGVGDGSEFTLVLATNGVAHPTGYPLYTPLGHLFCALLHALGAPWALAANVWSAVGAAVAVGFLHALAMGLTGSLPGATGTARFLAALVPTALFAFQPILIGAATSAEVNSWSLAWVCAAAYVFLRLAGGLTGADGAPRRLHRGAALWGLVCGIGLAHHLTSVLVSLPLTVGLTALLALRRRPWPGLLLAAVAAGLVPLASYGIIFWRAWHPALVQWPALGPGVASVLEHVTGAQYRHFIGYFDPAPDHRALLARAGYPFLFPGLALLLVGALRERQPERRMAWSALLVSALSVALFTFRYGVPDPAPYFLPAMALGAAAAAPALATLARAAGRWGALRIGVAGVAGLFLIVPWVRGGVEQCRDLLDNEAMIRSMWSAVPADTAIVLWPDDRFIHLVEYQILSGEKPALWIATPDMLLEDRTREELRARFGVDPLEGFRVPQVRPGSAEEDAIIGRALDAIVRNLNARTRVPVILFDPSVPVVRQLSKPWEPAEGSGARPATARPL